MEEDGACGGNRGCWKKNGEGGLWKGDEVKLCLMGVKERKLPHITPVCP